MGCLGVKELEECIGEKCLNTQRNNQEMAQRALLYPRREFRLKKYIWTLEPLQGFNGDYVL